MILPGRVSKEGPEAADAWQAGGCQVNRQADIGGKKKSEISGWFGVVHIP